MMRNFSDDDFDGRPADPRQSVDFRVGRIVASAGTVTIPGHDPYRATDTNRNVSVAAWTVALYDVRGGAWTDLSNPPTGFDRSVTNVTAAAFSDIATQLTPGRNVYLHKVSGRWWILAPGSAACDTIRFRMVSVLPWQPYAALVFPIAVTAGFKLTDVAGLTPLGTVVVCDPTCSFFNEPASNLLNRYGFAKYMQPLYQTICQPGYYPAAPQWEVISLACAVNPVCG